MSRTILSVALASTPSENQLESFDPRWYQHRYRPYRLLWLRVIVRAAFDFALYKDSKILSRKKLAVDAERWLFGSSEHENSLSNICRLLDIPLSKVRIFARNMTKDQVKKMEIIDRDELTRDDLTMLELENGED